MTNPTGLNLSKLLRKHGYRLEPCLMGNPYYRNIVDEKTDEILIAGANAKEVWQWLNKRHPETKAETA